MKAQEPSHIRIIEDEKPTSDPYTEWLHDRYIVSEVNSSEGALAQLDDSTDIVIFDCDFTEWTGTALLQETYNSGYDGGVVVLTETEPSIDIRGLAIDEYLVKPVSRDELINTVEQLRQVESYDALIEEYYLLVSKLTALHTTNSETELSDDERYTDLRKRIATLEADLDNITKELTEAEYHAAFRAVVE